jgi:hypothetical protein
LPVQSHRRQDIFVTVEDHLLGPELAGDRRLLLAAHRRSHPGALVDRELDAEMAEAARAAMY